MPATKEKARVSKTITFQKLAPVLVVDAIEPCIPFWVDRLGFAQVVEVPEDGRLGFVILAKDGVEVMYQTRASVKKDIGVDLKKGQESTALFIEVSDVDAVEAAMKGVEVTVARRQTFYGMDEYGVREPGGTSVVFAKNIETK
jgi:uncharacterized glyoxalase superfamily protein PhnB